MVSIRHKKEKEAQEEKQKMPVGAKVFDTLFTIFIYLVSAGILFGAVLFSFNTSADKALFGYRYYTVLTGSMSPTYNVGDMVFVQLREPEQINVGDVITFNPSQDSDAYLTHRVTEKLENYEGTGVTCFRTRGDANGAEDTFLIDGDRVIGTVKFGIPFLGYIVRFLVLRWYLIVPIVIMIAIFFQLLKRYFLIGDDDDEEDDTKDGEKDNDDSVKSEKVADTTEKEDPGKPEDKESEDEKPEDEKSGEKEGSGNKGEVPAQEDEKSGSSEEKKEPGDEDTQKEKTAE